MIELNLVKCLVKHSKRNRFFLFCILLLIWPNISSASQWIMPNQDTCTKLGGEIEGKQTVIEIFGWNKVISPQKECSIDYQGANELCLSMNARLPIKLELHTNISDRCWEKARKSNKYNDATRKAAGKCIRSLGFESNRKNYWTSTPYHFDRARQTVVYFTHEGRLENVIDTRGLGKQDKAWVRCTR